MAVASNEKQGTKLQGNKIESCPQNHLENYLSDLTRRRVDNVDPYIRDNQQGPGKHELDRSRWTGDL